MINTTALKSLLRRIDNITHVNKTDEAYYDATEDAMELSDILPDNKSIKIDIKILQKYDSKGSDRKKKYVIDEFKEDTKRDVFRLISTIESNLPNDL